MSLNPFFIINPNANTGKLGKKIDLLLDTIKQHFGDFEYRFTQRARDEYSIAQKAIEDGYKLIIAVGGDGTATNIGDVIVNNPDVKLGLISSGTACDWHKTHSLPRDLEKGLVIIKEGYSEKFAAIKCTGDKENYAFDMTDGGFTGQAAAAAHKEFLWIKSPNIQMNLLAVKYLLKFRNTPCTVTIDNNEPLRVEQFTNIFVALSDEIIGYKVMPGNSYFSQKNNDLGIVLIHGVKRLKRMVLLTRSINGKHIGMKGCWLTRGRKVVIESELNPLCWETEGEIFNENGMKVTLEYIENAINLIVPKDRDYPKHFNESMYSYSYFDSFKKRNIELSS